MTDEQDKVQERLQRMQKPAAKPPLWRKAAIPAATAVAGVGLGLYVALVPDWSKPTPSLMPTSEMGEFQSEPGLEAFEIVDTPPPAPVIEEEQIEVVEAQPEQDPRLAAEAEALRKEMDALKQQLADAQAAAENAGNSEELEAFRERLGQMEADSALREQAYNDMLRENTRLATELETKSLTDMEAHAEALRLAELEQRRAEEAKIRERQTRSPMIAYRSGGSGSAEREARDYEAGEDFVRAGSEKAEVTKSEVIANPSNTVIQGTLIEATLQTAINSQLPGNVTAVVSRDVWSMDMANVLIPQGSRLFGRYSSSVERGQRRVLVAWDRVVTPDGQSVVLAAYGADRMGRSGLTGKVNNHTLQRFGAAAAVSIINAVPSLIAAAIEKDRDDSISRDTAQNIGQGMSNAVGDVMADYLNVPTTISIDQGAVVLVMVNADLEMF